MRTANAFRRPRHGDDSAPSDAGITLVELVVAMSLMSVFMIMFTGAMLGLYRSANSTEVTSAAQSNLHVAFNRLDKEIRYSSGISVPARVGPDWHVEYLVTNTGTAVCNGLRLTRVAGQPGWQLQQRRWKQSSGPTAATAWAPLASNVSLLVAGRDTVDPFVVVVPGAASPSASSSGADGNAQRLRLRMAVSFGAGRLIATKQVDIAFSALNTSPNTVSATVCINGRTR
ncbi:MAG TPA: prepilin-type N-terminal cleavage/methylation domain-containing protein [Micromonosporaceae bacterium]|nr:prepilin-type N-terminal cleavage/methylation domain-containing protein [Micromonosporaceae bacterium]